MSNQAKFNTDSLKRYIAWLLISSMATPSFSFAAGTTPLVQFPPGNASRDPAPNVIITVDDSGSMAGAVGGGNNNSKMSVLKAALADAFSEAKIPDDRIRLAWQSMWGCNNFPGTKAGSYTGCATNSNLMRKFSGTHRTDFTNFINTLKPDSVTPSHRMIRQAGEYMKAAKSVNSPWAFNPGTTELPYLECRKTYHIFLTDGEWNSEVNSPLVNNLDGTEQTLPDGKLYSVTDDQTRAYRDIYGNTQETLSDLAFYYWSTDLQAGLENGPNTPATATDPEVRKGVQPIIRKGNVENVGGVLLDPYWNPRNDPATWQHITQYTIGFGDGATTWAGNPRFDNSVDAQGNFTNNNYGTVANGYAALVAGTPGVVWPNVIGGTARTSELWHMALNGRGKFFPARSAGALSSAFNEILDNIKADTSKPKVSIATTSSTLRNGSTAFVAGYNGEGWNGNVASRAVSSDGTVSAADIWDTATKLDDDSLTNSNPATRLILTTNDVGPVTFSYANLSAAQKAIFDGTGGLTGDHAVDFIRGSHADEQSATPVGPFRIRTKTVGTSPPVVSPTRQGDIVNSNIWLAGQPSSNYRDASYRSFRNSARTPVIYVGGNDGMLHGFNATSGAEGGKELLAYVPKGVIANLPKLTVPAYGDNSTGSTTTHLYYVDGTPFAGDVNNGGWKTYLAGTLGAGGKGYFILNVTNPSNFTAANATTLVKADNTYTNTDNTDPDIGNIFGDPALDLSNNSQALQFANLNGGGSALILGNGYNSTNGQAALLVHNLSTNNVTKVFVGSAGNNGLSTPRPIDINGDGKPDVVYAGDLQGNLWKFDFTSGVPSSGTKIYTTPNNRPIVTAPVWVPHPDGGIMLGFGTGQNLTLADRSDKTTQYTLYGIWDKGTISINSSNGAITLGATTPFSGTGTLVEKTIVSNSSGFRLTSNSAVNYKAPSNKRGWYLDLPLGERSLFNPSSFVGSLVFIPTTVPSAGSNVVGETCLTSTGAGYSYINILNLVSGNPPSVPVFDTNGDGLVNNSDTVASGVQVGTEVITLDKGGADGLVIAIGTDLKTETLSTGSGTVIHSGWRQLQ